MVEKSFTTKLSSRGQIVIPKDLRSDLKVGTPFIIDRKDDTIFLKKVNMKKEMEEFEALLKKFRARVKKSGLKQRDVPKIIERVREEIRREKITKS